jgi:methionyl-tRNA synthetase
MSKRRFYITTSIPTSTAIPHLGSALECVQADVLVRHRQLRGAVWQFRRREMEGDVAKAKRT